MRRIASNYIKFPDCELQCNSYVEFEDDRVVSVVPLGDQRIQEMEKVEFYSGILVKGDFTTFLSKNIGRNIWELIDEVYRTPSLLRNGCFCILSGMDWQSFKITSASKAEVIPMMK